MKVMNKRFAIISTAAALGLASLAWAGPDGDCPGFGGGPGDGPGGGMRGAPEQRWDMIQERQEARLNLLKERLNLTDDQQPAWQTFETAQKAQRSLNKGDMEQLEAAQTVPERFAQRIQFMEQRLSSMQTLAKAADDLYTQLSPAQKAVMDTQFAQRGGRHW